MAASENDKHKKKEKKEKIMNRVFEPQLLSLFRFSCLQHCMVAQINYELKYCLSIDLYISLFLSIANVNQFSFVCLYFVTLSTRLDSWVCSNFTPTECRGIKDTFLHILYVHQYPLSSTHPQPSSPCSTFPFFFAFSFYKGIVYTSFIEIISKKLWIIFFIFFLVNLRYSMKYE